MKCEWRDHGELYASYDRLAVPDGARVSSHSLRRVFARPHVWDHDDDGHGGKYGENMRQMALILCHSKGNRHPSWMEQSQQIGARWLCEGRGGDSGVDGDGDGEGEGGDALYDG